MGKYENLGAFLHKQRAREVPLTFREIEKITGAKLPPKAQHHRAGTFGPGMRRGCLG